MPDIGGCPILFLPGASGDGAFWRGVGGRLTGNGVKRYLDWPGLGEQSHDPSVRGFADLSRITEQALAGPSVIVAQSMGGIVALDLALRHPDMVSRLVLCGTSGGLDMAAFGAHDWRESFLADFPDTARWVLTERPDHSRKLHRIAAPTLLLWGSQDRISPPAVGEHLSRLIPDARLVIVEGGEHDFACRMLEVVAGHIAAFLNGAAE